MSEPLRPGAVRTLPKDGAVSVAIGLENHPAAIRSPDRKAIVAFVRQAAQRVMACHVVEPDHGWVIAALGTYSACSKGNALPIWRDARRREMTNRKIETLYFTASIGESHKEESVRVIRSG